jgi:uncharacterized membrane protein YbhN (UPF0104 family)
MRDAAFGWLALAVALHLANQVARGRGWCAAIALARPGGERPCTRDVIAAWVAGAGMGGVLSARGGDAVRLLLLRRRLPSEGYPLLAGTLVAEATGETAIGLLLLAIAVAAGFGAGPSAADPSLLWMAPVIFGVVAVAAFVRCRSRVVRRITAELARGCSSLRNPRAFARTVAPWQVASRLLRGASLACFLVGFGLPATMEAVVVVMLAQSGGRLLPLAPASVAATVAMLVAAFPSFTGVHVDVATVTEFVVGMSTLLTVVGVVLAAAVAIPMLPRTAPSAWRALLNATPAPGDGV